ncbi:MAG: lamin tail domain-containing protein, partial [Bacteroidales bacterium]|nr:lamin tail domain-containing protein [Bacteroidales bacterium]
MKKVFIFLMLALFAFSVNAQVFITELADPDNDAGARFVELYNAGSSAVDFSTGWQINRYTNGNAAPQTPVDLTGTIAAGGFYIIAANGTQFNTVYGFDADQSIGTGGPADSNGDDQIFLLSPGSVVVDFFGVIGEDGSNTCHEFEDGRAERAASVTTGNSGTWDEANWNVWSDASTASGCTNHISNAPQDAPGDFDPGTWIGASSNDQTSTVTAPGTQLVAGTISSIGTDSVPVIRFDITDAASGDGLPTNVTGVYFVAGPNNTLPIDSLNGGGIYDLTNGIVIPLTGEPTGTATSVYLPVNISIPDGATVSFEAYAYINNSYAPDGAVLQFQINAASHGFTAAASGSDFEATFAGGDIVGNDFTVDVVATQFTFLTQPSDVVISQNMSNVVVGTTDAGGNVDVDNNLQYIQVVFSGAGNMYGTNGLSTNNGICTYTDLNFDTPESAVHLTAHDGNGTMGFTDVNSTNFNVLSGSGGASCANAVSIDVGTHHAIHTATDDYDQWYVYHATADGTITAENCSSGYGGDTYLEIIEGSCSGTNFDLADDICGSLETLTFDVTAGNDYYIAWGDYDTGTPGEYDWTLSFTAAPTPVNIVNAYAVSNDSLVVYYESSLTSVNPADYTLTATGQTTVNFTAASIDATYDSIVYLKAQNNFTLNTIRDNLNDAANSTTYQFYAGVLPVSYTNTANDPDTVRQDYNVTLSGVVTANDNYNQVWMQDSENPMSGVLIYSSSFDALVSVGDNITIVGQKALYNGATEIVNPVLINSAAGGTPVAAAVDATDLDYAAGQDDANSEPWEGQLVTVTGIVIDSLNTSHYEYFGHTCNGTIICFDDDVDYHYGSGFALTTGNMYSVTGVVTYSYGHYKINPRETADATEIVRDMTSVVEDPDTQVPASVIDGTLAIDSLNAIEAFKFKVTDEGTDGLPTKLSQITIYIGPDNTIDFSGDAIDGGWFDFGDAANPIQFAAEPVFDTDHFTFAVDPESAVIDNGTSKEVILHVWFDPAYLVDESVIQLMVQADPHGFVADCMNSQFASTFASDVTGGTLTIDTNISIEDVNGKSISVYPNPSNGIFNINVKDTYNLEITDITGRVINSRM